MDSVCSNCGEPAEPILLRITTSTGETVAEFSAQESKDILDFAIHHMFDTVITPMARKSRAAHGDSNG